MTPAAGPASTLHRRGRARPPWPCPHPPRGTTRPGPSTGARKVSDTRIGGGLGEPWTPTTERSSSCSAGCSGNSEATCASGPTPSITTSNRGTSSSPLAHGRRAARHTTRRTPRGSCRAGCRVPGSRAPGPGRSPPSRQRGAGLGLVALRVAGGQEALVAPPDVDPGPVDRVAAGLAPRDRGSPIPWTPRSGRCRPRRATPGRRRPLSRGGPPRRPPAAACRGARRPLEGGSRASSETASPASSTVALPVSPLASASLRAAASLTVARSLTSGAPVLPRPSRRASAPGPRA